MSDESHCRGCGAEIVWAITLDAKRAPIRKDPRPDGNVLIFRDPRLGTLQARTFAGFVLDELRDQGVPMRLNHFADCPERERFAS